MHRLVLVDGNAILHRAYHALPPLTASDGSLVNAVYGFTSMLSKIYSDFQPSHLAVAFDRPAPTFRKEIYKEYQAKRPKMDEELIPQVEKVHQVVRAMGIPTFEMDGFEADDVIGTITKKVMSYEKRVMGKPIALPITHNSSPITQTIIVTGDRDLLQLVENDRVLVYMPTKGLSEGKLYGEKEVEERIGVKPKQIPDFKALAGDSSDNYPGVEGIGPKTAVKLLREYGSIENLYKRSDRGDWGEKEGKVKEKLGKDREKALLSYRLAVLKNDVPIEISIQPLETLDTPAARETLEKLGFKSLLKRLEKMPSFAPPTGEATAGKRGEKKQKGPDQMTLL